ncbi:MAG: hypothetical protein HY282_02570 [Nitrospirae bacterium]|nr:hypothetical protein [Candidatus Manganitrophaceae bacterium]
MTVAYYPLLILLAPLAAAGVNGLLEGALGRKAYRISAAAQAVALAVSLWTLKQVAGNGPIDVPIFSSAWGGALQFGLYIDRLAAVMLTLVSAIGFLISLFSVSYMQQERGRTRFHTLLALLIFILLSMVASKNLMMLFIFWQLISWMLYLLSHHYSHPQTLQGATKTYTTLRIGDVAFLAGVVLAYRVYGTLDFPQLFINAAAQTPERFSLWPGWSIGAPTLITLLIFVGAMSKSVQFPMHIWLPGNLYAPTPVTALLHAGIINAGGFLLNRLAPLYGQSPATLHFALAIGLLTTLLGATMMLTQNDIKKTLAHSTIGQMGYMIMECGLGGFALAIFHLIAHGLFKATVFLDSGHVIHAARQEPRHPPHDHPEEVTEPEEEFSGLTWGAGFLITLLFPLIILLAAHGALRIPLIDSQGAVIFLFFSWVTSSQAILTLYRLRAVSSWKVASIMLFTLLLVVVTYLFAAERFTDFLYPAPGEALAYFQAAHLPAWLFDTLVVAIALGIISGWSVIYARSHGRTIPVPKAAKALQVRLYILFMNRLYLEALYARLGRGLTNRVRRIDQSPLRWIWAGVALVVALVRLFPAADRAGELSFTSIVLFSMAALLLPLFPLQWLYVTALTRLTGVFPALLAVLMPIAGFYAIQGLLSGMSPELLGAVRALALFGAVYGTIKALAQFRVERLIAYAGVAFASILWWYLAGAAADTPQAAVYVSALSLITGGLFLAWRVVQLRYGNLDLNRIGGLARPMPRFALLLSLLVTAAMGLPPFGLFSGLIELLFNRSVPMSWDLAVILLTWLAASWFFLNLMQRLLFGPHRPGIPYTDLSRAETASLATALLLLLILGLAPYGFFETTRPAETLPPPPATEINAAINLDRTTTISLDNPTSTASAEGEALSAEQGREQSALPVQARGVGASEDSPKANRTGLHIESSPTQTPMNRAQRATASVEGEAHPILSDEGATRAPYK